MTAYIYVIENGTGNYIIKFDTAGEYISRVRLTYDDGASRSQQDWVDPWGICHDTNKLYITDNNAAQDKLYAVFSDFTSHGSSPYTNSYDGPRGVEFYGTGASRRIYVCDYNNGKISHSVVEDTSLGTTADISDASLTNPVDLTFGSDGTIYAAVATIIPNGDVVKITTPHGTPSYSVIVEGVGTTIYSITHNELCGGNARIFVAVDDDIIAYTETGTQKKVESPSTGYNITGIDYNGSKLYAICANSHIYEYTYTVATETFTQDSDWNNYTVYDPRGISVCSLAAACIYKGSLIDTPIGCVKIEDIRSGDKVLDDVGDECVVKHLVIFDIYRRHKLLKADKGSLGEGLPTEEFIIGEAHPMKLKSSDELVRARKFATENTSDNVPQARCVNIVVEQLYNLMFDKPVTNKTFHGRPQGVTFVANGVIIEGLYLNSKYKWEDGATLK